MTIDVHGHITSPELFKRFPMPPSLADIDGMIEQKADLGITMTIVGSPVGAGTMIRVSGLDNYAQPADQLESFHDWAAETIRAHWANLRGYVYLNPYADDDSLARTAKLLAQPEFVGLIVNSSVRGRYLDGSELDSFFALAAEHEAPILLHPPAEPAGSEALASMGLVEHLARPCDITVGVAAILNAGWLTKYPALKLIAPNAGGALSLLREKLDLARKRMGPHGAAPAPAGPPLSEALRQVYVDTATPSTLALRAATEVFGPAHMLFGTDSPPLATPLATALRANRELPVSERELADILENNARRLFRLNDTGSAL